MVKTSGMGQEPPLPHQTGLPLPKGDTEVSAGWHRQSSSFYVWEKRGEMSTM